MNKIDEVFEITKEHLRLLQRMYVTFDDEIYYGAPAIDVKRPYGNKTVYEDISEMLGWHYMDWENYKPLPEKIETACKKIHKETETALQICLCTQKFETGVYKKHDRFNDRSWTKIEGDKDESNA